MYVTSTDWAVFLPSTSDSVSMCRPEVGPSNLGQLFCSKPWSEAQISYMGGGWARVAADQLERGDPEGAAGETWTASVDFKMWKTTFSKTCLTAFGLRPSESTMWGNLGGKDWLKNNAVWGWNLTGDFFSPSSIREGVSVCYYILQSRKLEHS